MNDSLPLLTRNPDHIIAIVGDRPITCRQFLRAATTLADALPEAPLAFNLCDDRYAFLVAFVAAVIRGQANVLLPSRQPMAIAEALARIDGHHVMHDGAFAELARDRIDIRPFVEPSAAVADVTVPSIPAGQLSAIVFTSGSTGESTQVRKFWRTLVTGTAINRRYTLHGIDGPAGIVATVPPWHMYGLEYTVLLPLCENVHSYTGNTLFPGDIRNALERTPGQRICVTTPVHLRAILRSGLTFPPVRRILCATAPLTRELATDAARALGGDLCELYGCTEAGCLAHRNPVAATEWTFFEELQVNRTGRRVSIDAAHLPEPVMLTDDLVFTADGRFELRGRGADLVKIGGKRGSLAELTNRLLQIDGVEDAVVFSPNPDAAGDGNEARLSALVVCPGRDIGAVRDELARVIDPVFMPRPLRRVDELPRNQTGKLRRLDLQRLGADPTQ